MNDYNKTKVWYISLNENFINSISFKQLLKQDPKYGMLFILLINLTKNEQGKFELTAGKRRIIIDDSVIMTEIPYFRLEEIKAGLEAMYELGLIETEEEILKISNIENFIGYKTVGAMRRAEQREKKRLKELIYKNKKEEIENE